MSSNIAIAAGRSYPMGAHFDGDGVNFAVYSRHATRMVLCLFDDEGREHINIDLPERDGFVWHGYVPGLRPGQTYGYRASGPYRPDEGHRFNPHKLLIDPYAKRLTGHPVLHRSLFGYDVDAKHGDLTFDTQNSAPYMPRAIVTDDGFDWGGDRPLGRPLSETILYEAHVKGMTAGHPALKGRGDFLAMASDPILEHLTKLGVTAVELLPVHASLTEGHLVAKGLTNYWGYMSYGFFAPDPRFMTTGDISEFQQMVKRFHSAGIEVILDVVYNHTAEGNQMGPTLSFRGLDNASYYRLAETPRYYIDDTGTGNTLDFDSPPVLRMVMDSLRYWTETMHVDGFRFDLASTLARTRAGFDRKSPFLNAVRQDPVLAKVKLIAEPWDVGPGGYQMGAFPPPFAEWNDKYRDQIRRFWRGDAGHFRKLAIRLSGSALRFDHDGRQATSSVNFLTAHDGFTLMDLVSYNQKHNAANLEDNRDGHDHNNSDNCGVEGASSDPAIIAKRAQRRRNLFATLMLSQGTPMMLGGDELSNSQGGNNNAYCQDNEISWVDWDNADPEFLAFCQKVIAFRKAQPILRQKKFLHSRNRMVDGASDIAWLKADGTRMAESDWSNLDQRHIAVVLRMAAGSPEFAPRGSAIYAVFNTGDTVTATLPPPSAGHHWVRHIDSASPSAPPKAAGETEKIHANSVAAFVQEPVADTTREDP